MSSVSPSDDPVDAIDQYNLGVRYTNGDNATQDDVLAAIWYRKSAEQGHAEAQCDLGVSYVHGSGVPQSFEMALKWFRKAAEQGECAAEHNLGVLYAAGKGVTKNLEVAAAWYSKAADQGHIKAKLKFQHLLDSGIRPASPELLKGIDPETLNGDLKKELQIRKSAVARRDLPPEMPKGDTIPCPTCGVKIARHILKSHQREYHRPLPNLNQPRQPKKPITKSTCPALPLPSVELDYPVRNTVGSLALCPRCSGDGGVRAGCRKCDGTGWVPKEMERDLVFRPDQHVAENSRISNSDYLGGNDGAHFREMDGRIGTIPMFDDYGEES
ncbi:tetratricopeptide repeat protein [Pseudomonas sp. SIMBA_041]|uniref:tetratricopeptide repeat protein n=1 Tax=Pseudomonas sp. SIMBA_041 TaxID=3085782 RepID=UPI00397D6644